jgi:hypothetical protein
MDMANGPDGRQAEERREHWRRARRAELRAHRGDVGGVPEQLDVLEGPGFLYRPRQVLYQTGVMQTQPVESRLESRGGHPDYALNQGFAAAKLSVAAYLMPPGVDIPELVAELRQHEDGESAPNVGPNHVFCGEPDYQGGPDGPPGNAGPFPEAPYATREPGAPGVAVLDTGYDTSVPALHIGLGWRVAFPAGETENPLTAGGYFAQEAGHGTFIDGIIMRLAPLVPIRQVKVLDPSGVTDDGCVARAMTQHANAPVINLSLGGYTQDDMPPVASGQALAQLTDAVTVVAAAGNNGSPEPFWPAAFKGVVAVGALDTTQGQPQRAAFSNYGHWVDIYAPGVNVYSTYLQGTWDLPPNPASWPIDGYAIWSGTSFAAPQVAAAIADTMRQAPGITSRQAAHMVLGAAPWQPGVGPVYIPSPGVIALSGYPP